MDGIWCSFARTELSLWVLESIKTCGRESTFLTIHFDVWHTYFSHESTKHVVHHNEYWFLRVLNSISCWKKSSQLDRGLEENLIAFIRANGKCKNFYFIGIDTREFHWIARKDSLTSCPLIVYNPSSSLFTRWPYNAKYMCVLYKHKTLSKMFKISWK